MYKSIEKTLQVSKKQSLFLEKINVVKSFLLSVVSALTIVNRCAHLSRNSHSNPVPGITGWVCANILNNEWVSQYLDD